MTVRIGRCRDAALLSALHGACFDRGWDAAAFGEILAMPGAAAWSAETDDGPTGFIVLRQAADEAEIITVGTVPEQRRGGLAARLIRHSAGELTGCARLFLEVAARNSAARALYARLGFNEVGRRRKYYDNGDDALVLARSLPFSCEASAPSLYSAHPNERDN